MRFLFRIPLTILDSFLETASSHPDDWEDLKVVALAAGREKWPDLSTDARRRWMAVLASLRSSWRITVGWGEPGDASGDSPGLPAVRWLSVLDCGAERHPPNR